MVEMFLQIKDAVKRGTEPELLAAGGDYTLLYHLSRDRENIISVMDIRPTDHVLEVGAEMGALSGALADRAMKTVCLEPRDEYMEVAMLRHAARENLAFVSGDIQAAQSQAPYDVVVAVVALARAHELISAARENAREALLGCFYELLKPGGRLYLALHNRLSARHFSGHPDEDSGAPFGGLTCRPHAALSGAQAIALLESTGFSDFFVYYPYPDHVFSAQIFSQSYPPGKTLNYNPAWLDARGIRTFNEVKALQSLSDLEEQKILANSLLIEALKA